MPCRLSAGSTFLRLAWIVSSVGEGEGESVHIYKQGPSVGETVSSFASTTSIFFLFRTKVRLVLSLYTILSFQIEPSFTLERSHSQTT
jgi:hypothetical protein